MNNDKISKNRFYGIILFMTSYCTIKEYGFSSIVLDKINNNITNTTCWYILKSIEYSFDFFSERGIRFCYISELCSGFKKGISMTFYNLSCLSSFTASLYTNKKNIWEHKLKNIKALMKVISRILYFDTNLSRHTVACML